MTSREKLPDSFPRRRLSFVLSLAAVFALVSAQASSAQMQIKSPTETQIKPAGEARDYIVAFAEGVSSSERAAIARRAGAIVRFNYTIVNAVAVRVPNSAVLSRLQSDPRVIAIIEDRVVQADQGEEISPSAGKPPKGGGDRGGELRQDVPEKVGGAAGRMHIAPSQLHTQTQAAATFAWKASERRRIAHGAAWEYSPVPPLLEPRR